MLVWRMVRRSYVSTAFSGIGASLIGGRWNPVGVPMVYCSEGVAVAAWELFVNVDRRIPPRDLVLIPVEIPSVLRIEEIDLLSLPRNWRKHPAPTKLKQLGKRWVQRGESAVLKVPSAVIPMESNYLINPNHPDAQLIRALKPIPFDFDPRAFEEFPLG
jgi:RES domain-containing protein